MDSQEPLIETYFSVLKVLFEDSAVKEAVNPSLFLLIGHSMGRYNRTNRTCGNNPVSDCERGQTKWREFLDKVFRDGHDNLFGQDDLDQMFIDFIELLVHGLEIADGKVVGESNCVHPVTIRKFINMGVDVHGLTRGLKSDGPMRVLEALGVKENGGNGSSEVSP